MTNPWTQNPAYARTPPYSYAANGSDGGLLFGINTSLTLLNSITIPDNVGSARLSFYSRFFNDPDDTGNVEISTNGGAMWTSLKVLNNAPDLPPADTRMQCQEVNLTAYRGIPFKLRFRYDTGGLFYYFVRSLGWWVDSINLDAGTWTQIGTTGAATTSLSITNKLNGHYYYRVRGIYRNGRFTTNSNVQDIIVNGPNPPHLVSVVSRKTHNGVGDFDISLPLTGTRGVECRNGGASGNHKLIFTFSAVVSNCGTASSGVASNGPNSNQCTVSLSGVGNAQYLQVNLTGVANAGGGVADITGPSAGFLIGDTTADATANSADISQTKSQSGRAVGSSNFRNDVNADGSINSADISLVKSKSGTALP